MDFNKQQTNKLELSIFHYFLWQEARLAAQYASPTCTVTTTKSDDTFKFSKNKVSSRTKETCEIHQISTEILGDKNIVDNSFRVGKYRKVIEVLRQEFDHIAKTETDRPRLFDVPEVYSRWMLGCENDSNREGIKRTDVYVSPELISKRENKKNDNCVDIDTAQGEHVSQDFNKATDLILPVANQRNAISLDIWDDDDESIELKRSYEEATIRRNSKNKSWDSKIAKKSTIVGRDDVPEDVQKRITSICKENLQSKRTISLLESKLTRAEGRMKRLQEKFKADEKSKIEKIKSKFEKEKVKMKDEQVKLLAAKKRRREENKKNVAPLKKYLKWDDRFAQLLEFHTQHGHCKVPYHYNRCPSGLGEWCAEQRKYYRKQAPILTQDRIDKLNELGFLWNPPAPHKTFQARIEECKEFLAKFGHLNIPPMATLNEDGTELTESEKSFRCWAAGIRKQYRRRAVEGVYNKLDKIRIKALEEVGFVWNLDSETTHEANSPLDDMFADRVDQLRKVKEMHGNCNERKHILGTFPNNPELCSSLCSFVKRQRLMFKCWKEKKSSSMTIERLAMLSDVGFDFTPRKHYSPPTKKRKVEKHDSGGGSGSVIYGDDNIVRNLVVGTLQVVANNGLCLDNVDYAVATRRHIEIVDGTEI